MKRPGTWPGGVHGGITVADPEVFPKFRYAALGRWKDMSKDEIEADVRGLLNDTMDQEPGWVSDSAR